MKHFTKPDGSVWAFESDGSQDEFITEDMTPISDADLAALRAGQLAAEITVPPPSITMRQARLALLGAGLLDTVNQGIKAMPMNVQIEWEFAATVDRASPLVTALAGSLELDDKTLDALFLQGGAL